MKRILVIFAICILTIIKIPPVYAIEEKPEIIGPTGIVMDFTTGQVLYDKNMNQRMYPASTTKTLTAIIAIEKGHLNDIVTANDDVTKVDGNSMYLKPGEKLTLEQLLYAMLLESDNDAAIDVADYIGGNIKNFAVMMNDKAKEIGAKNSHFVNPNGLPNKDHYSTPYDMALIARYAMKNNEFRKIVSTIHYQIPPTNMYNKTRDLWISNRLIKPSSFHYDGADGVKTGYTVTANQVLIASATRNNHRLISVIMGDIGTNIWSDTIKLLNYGFNNYTLIKLNDKNTVSTYIDVGKAKFKLPLLTRNAFYYEVPIGDEKNVKSFIELKKDIKAPIYKDSVLGYLKYKLNGKIIGKIPLITNETVYKNIMGTYYDQSDNKKAYNYDIIKMYVEIIAGCILILTAFILWRKKKIRSKNRFIFTK